MEYNKSHITTKHTRYRVHTMYLLSCMLLLTAAIPTRSNEEYEEISVYLSVQDIGGTEMPAVIYEESLYLPVADLFDFLRIRNTVSIGLDSVSGTYIQAQSDYLIDYTQRRILYQGKVFPL